MMNADRVDRFRLAATFLAATFHAEVLKTGTACRPYLLQSRSQEIVMTSSRTRPLLSRLILTAAIAAGQLSAHAAFASQGPGGGQGTAGSFTRLAMAVLVYGAAALVIGAGLIGAMRRR